jgi:hypothetical protein
MAPVAWPDVVAYSSPLAAVNITVQTDLLAWVNKSFSAVFDGEDGVKTRLARIYAAAHMASLPGAGEQRPGGAVVAESRGGLSRSYAPPPVMNSNWWALTQWGQRYLLLLDGSKAMWPRAPGMRVPG